MSHYYLDRRIERKTYSFNKFIEMLHKLDIILDRKIDYDIEFEIYAIGGFSMMYNSFILNGARARNKSVDIDTMSFIEPEVRECIAIAGNGDDHWINDEWYKEAMGCRDELFNKEEFVKDNEYNFKHIKLYVANIATLLNFKMRAFENKIMEGEDPRESDYDDVYSIISYLGFDEEQFYKEMCKMGIEDRFSHAVEFILNDYLFKNK